MCIHKSIFNNEPNDRKIINNYFLNKTNGQTCLKKVNGVKYLGTEGVIYIQKIIS
jgi:hypothetical protein